MSEQNPQDRCGYEHSRPHSPLSCCYRPIWKDHDKCIWHAEEKNKPQDELVEARADKPEKLDNSYLAGVEIEGGISFEECSLSFSNFSKSHIIGVNFSKSNLYRASFSECILDTVAHINGQNVDAMGYILEEKELDGIQEVDYPISRVNFTNSFSLRSDFSNSTLRGADLSDSFLQEADFYDSDLIGINGSNSDFYDADLSNTVIGKAQFLDANLQRADLTNALGGPAYFEDAKLKNTILKGAKIPGSNLKNISISDCDLTDCKLNNSDMNDMWLMDTNLHNTNLAYADLSNSRIWSSNFSDIGSEGITINNTSVRKSKFSGSDMTQAEITSSEFIGCDFTDSNLANANLSGTILEKSVFTRTNLFDCELIGCALYGAIFNNTQVNERTEFGKRSPYDPDSRFELSTEYLYDRIDIKDGISSEEESIEKEASELIQKMTDGHGNNTLSNEEKEVRQLTKAAGSYRIVEKLAFDNELSELGRRKFRLRKDMRTKMYKVQKQWVRYSSGIVAKIIMGYGENPWRVIGTSTVIISACSLLYPLGLFEETTTESTPIMYSLEGDPSRLFDSIYYSTMVFTSLGTNGFQPIGWGRLIAMGQTISGAILMAILVFVLSRRATR